MENVVNSVTSNYVRHLYVVRDTATGHDSFEFTASCTGEAFARLASIVCGTQRLSFELYLLGHYKVTDTHFELVPVDRSYVCTASQAMLDSFVEDIADVLDNEESPCETNNA